MLPPFPSFLAVLLLVAAGAAKGRERGTRRPTAESERRSTPPPQLTRTTILGRSTGCPLGPDRSRQGDDPLGPVAEQLLPWTDTADGVEAW